MFFIIKYCKANTPDFQAGHGRVNNSSLSRVYSQLNNREQPWGHTGGGDWVVSSNNTSFSLLSAGPTLHPAMIAATSSSIHVFLHPKCKFSSPVPCKSLQHWISKGWWKHQTPVLCHWKHSWTPLHYFPFAVCAITSFLYVFILLCKSMLHLYPHLSQTQVINWAF